jgi:hypothetical protein
LGVLGLDRAVQIPLIALEAAWERGGFPGYPLISFVADEFNLLDVLFAAARAHRHQWSGFNTQLGGCQVPREMG